ncbi:hypothetical protein LXA47_19935 [Massilia sp. P8910]|uniref:hypothetical protein n=1 Tax=Massilia antarctica TaxID=2765360 RepID=UPI001E3B04D1|nr:hypothetical protein [Massilia antarctica]MCE3605856.1 hypothetical protein [Massilia antarctica]
MNNLNNPTQAAPSCPLCCAKKGEPHSAGCKNSAPPRITMTPLLRRALEDWARSCEGAPSADAALLDLLNLMAGPAGAAPTAVVPAGMALVPVMASHAISSAIEEEIDDQLEASGIRPRDMLNQDGDRVWNAALLAVQRNDGA